ncbi:hypothetical protein [Shewanella sp. NIFS-20-20]|uniref:hypothetical protein n=1 Tax=Shewanella sp. NIFS-20-20 TaxID=2853806 RepID=UPI001C453B3B|nr:hypothetical protein [Shewanella sp. NIFS-20-20]MBV7314979.1 hypothetical protein [Shewanella sp. NIFS-20-20]
MSSMLKISPWQWLTSIGATWQLDDSVAVNKRAALTKQGQGMEERELVGQWFDPRPDAGDKITIYRRGDEWFVETWSDDGCHSLDKMKATPENFDIRLEEFEANFFGEYFLMTDYGDLKLCDAQGCVILVPMNSKSA